MFVDESETSAATLKVDWIASFDYTFFGAIAFAWANAHFQSSRVQSSWERESARNQYHSYVPLWQMWYGNHALCLLQSQSCQIVKTLKRDVLMDSSTERPKDWRRLIKNGSFISTQEIKIDRQLKMWWFVIRPNLIFRMIVMWLQLLSKVNDWR